MSCVSMPDGIHPNIDLSDLGRVIDTVEICNKIPDAIKKGFKVGEEQGKAYEDEWEIPYFPLDAQVFGRTYEAVVRVNSQSGKDGAAWIILRKLELDHPRADTLRGVGIELDVADYKEHAIEGRREVKAATYIECMAAGTSQKVWGVGIYEDVVQSSLMALLGTARNLRPPTVANGSVTSHAGPSDLVQKLEEKVNGM
ncbi:hypothetical protein DL767_004813 [Monosporascus sp. MG133]|nr:hypothetical protein DL767_004813 [Monosporascus sp. MG133]